MTSSPDSILHRVGTVVLLAGLIDIALIIVCITAGIPYSSCLNVLAVAAGMLLLRGSLRAAGRIRWIAVFMLALLAALVPAWSFLQPFDLTLAHARFSPAGVASRVASLACTLALLAWVVRQLGHPDIVAASRAGGRKVRDLRIPAALGLAAMVLLVVMTRSAADGATAARARAQAAQQLGPGYRLHVSSMHVLSTGGRTTASGVVTAWNEHGIRQVPVQWQEP